MDNNGLFKLLTHRKFSSSDPLSELHICSCWRYQCCWNFSHTSAVWKHCLKFLTSIDKLDLHNPVISILIISASQIGGAVLSKLWPLGCVRPKMAMNVAQHKIVNLLKTLFFTYQSSLVFVYLMCGPRQLFFFQCGPEMPKGCTPL